MKIPMNVLNSKGTASIRIFLYLLIDSIHRGNLILAIPGNFEGYCSVKGFPATWL